MPRVSLFLIIICFLISCGQDNQKERPSTPRIKKEVKILSPTQNLTIMPSDTISVKIDQRDVVVDSIWIEIGKMKYLSTKLTYSLPILNERVGSKRIKITAFFDGKKETHTRKIIVLSDVSPKKFTYEVVNTFPHDTKDYTQGLLIDNGFLYESTGRNRESTLKKKEIETGNVLTQINLSDEYFGEGLTFYNDQLLQLTYTSGACFVYDRDMNLTNTFSYQGEGWGLCQYEDQLLMTDGSEKLFVRNPSSFSIVDEIEVYDNKGKVSYLNELEVIGSLVYANIYQKDLIIGIDPGTGKVLEEIDLSGILPSSQQQGVDVLNGIAYDSENERIFVTGKLWPSLFEIKFKPLTDIQ